MRARASVLLAVAVVGASAAGVARAGDPGSAAEILAAEQKLVAAHKASQEAINDRQKAVIRANAVIDEADAAFQAQNYDEALKKFREVVALLPSPTPAAARVQNHAYDGIAACLLILAKRDVEGGRLDDARAKADEALAYAPKDPRVRTERRALYASMGIELDSADRPIIEDNPAVTPKFLKDLVDVRRLLAEGEDFLETGQYDAAEQRFGNVLKLDPYNKEARNKMREVDQHKMRYAHKTRVATRAEAMLDVDAAWELPVPREVEGNVDTLSAQPISRSNVADIENRLRRLIVPRAAFEAATIDEVAAFLRGQVLQLEPGRPPINFVSRLAADTPKSDVTLSLENVPLYDIVKYAAQVSNLKFRIEEFAVLFLPLTETSDQLITREYRVQPAFLSASVSAEEAAATSSSGGGGRGRGRSLIERVSIVRETDIKSYLESKGVTFPTGAQVVFSPISNKLVVRNTPENLELIDLLVGGAEVIPQVEIATKFVEFNQEDLDELSIAMNIVKENGEGSGDNNHTAAYPDQSIYQDNIGMNPNNMDGLNNLDGLRSSADLRRSSLDSLLSDNSPLGFEPPRPNNFNFMATVFNYKVDTLIRTLAQKKSTDLLSAPKVVARTGENAKIKVIRRFWYPTAFEAPELPSEASTGGGGGTVVITPTAPVATPANPTDFEEKELGVILDVRPAVGPDNYTIDMDLVPRVVEFEGFVNYGTPLGVTFEDPGRTPIVISDNFINQPVFNSREIKTSVKVYDGHTLVLGGLMREDTQVFNDKVPFFGDLPLFGRLFRSKVEQAVKKNLLIFVTPTLVTPSGELVNPPEPLVLPDKTAARK